MRGYAAATKAQCVGTQRRRRRSAWVRRVDKGAVRGCAEQQWFRCVRTVKVRGAIDFLGAYRCGSTRRDSASECVLYAARQKKQCVVTQCSRRISAGIRREAEGEVRSDAG